MALQTSGMISLGQIHAEAGGSSTGACTINDSDIRGLIGKASGAAMDFADWYGASATLDTQTVTVGTVVPSLYNARLYGWCNTAGSISDGSFNPKSNTSIVFLAWAGAWSNGTVENEVTFTISGTHSNSGFTTMTVGSTAFNRSSASFSQSGGNTKWVWSTGTNPFGTSGTKTVVFT